MLNNVLYCADWSKNRFSLRKAVNKGASITLDNNTIKIWSKDNKYLLRQRLLVHYHEYYGHVGIAKLIRLIQRRFHWPGMTAATHHSTKACTLCQRMKKSNLRHSGELQTHVLGHVNEVIAIDFFGPLPTGRSNARYVVAIEDVYSEYVRLFPIKSTTTIKCVNR